MLTVPLTDAARADLRRLRDQPRLPTKVRDRVEMVLLSAAGWSPRRIADHLDYCAHTVRGVLHDYRRRGTAACTPARTGPPPDGARRERVQGLLRGLLAEPRTWTAGQLAEALGGSGVRLGERQVRRHLRLLGAGYHRTVASVRHKQDPAKAARAERTLAGLKKRPRRAG